MSKKLSQEDCTCEVRLKGGKPHPGLPDVIQNVEREIVKHDPDCPLHGRFLRRDPKRH